MHKSLEHVEFGDKLETIRGSAFYGCASMKRIKIPKVRVIKYVAFRFCSELMDVELSEDLETIGGYAFGSCPHLVRIAVPLKENM